ncbi:C40 family peptidase [Bacillus sp. FJAT-29937]|uniref:C40 family peptidase n=1 Tax=Bacillus sp. FJAT-29937 TaxID=1720553 RepID=UPI000836CB3B|nr:C40 family peptidase [Bacillus sp. FJAT-29937]
MKKLAKVIITASLLFPTFFGVSQASAAEQTTNTNLIEYSRNLIGIPYVYGGESTSGFDCSGFLSYVYSHFGVNLPRISTDQYHAGKPVDKADLVPGDAVFFITVGNRVSHSGIYIGDNQFIHADSTRGIKISNLSTESYWKNRYAGAKRFVELESPPAPPADGKFMGLDLKENQIGVVEIKKPINLWKRDSNNKLEMVRVLQPGDKFRVYTYDSNHGGQYGLGGTFITDMKTHIEYHALDASK